MRYNGGMTVAEERTRAEVSSLGARLRDRRPGRGWTLDELARRAGLSKSYLSRLEDGDRQPSLASLLSLAQAHGVPLASLFGGAAAEEARGPALSCGPARPASARQRADLHAPVPPGRGRRMQPVRVVVSARREGDEMSRHDGEEWLLVLSGTLRLALDDETHVLHPGDSAHFDARRPHRLSALDGRDAELILVACAGSPRTLLASYLLDAQPGSSHVSSLR